MKKINSKILIDTLQAETKVIISAIETKFKILSGQELNYKSKGWSINECFEHLNRADDHYLDLFEMRLSRAQKVNPEYDFVPGMLGNYFTKTMKPTEAGEIKSKMKTFSKFQPQEEKLSMSMEVFLKDQYKLLDILEQSRTVDLNKLRIHSAIGKVINFKMGDALRFVIAHNQRHMLQAENVLKEMGQSVVAD